MAAGLVLLHPRVVEVEGGDHPYQIGLDIGLIAAAGNLIGPTGKLELLELVAVTLHEDKEILVEVHILLSDLALHEAAVALGHFHGSLAASPVDERNRDSDLHHLVAAERRIAAAEITVGAGVAELGEKIDLTLRPFGLGHFVIGLEPPAHHVLGKLIVCKGLLQGVGVINLRLRNVERDFRPDVDILAVVEERAELEHIACQVALAVGHLGAGVDEVEFHLQQVVAADLPHLALRFRHFVKALGVLEVAGGDTAVFLRH